MCAHMDVSLIDSLLGYKFSGDPACTLPYHLSNEEELHDAMKKGIEKMKRSRKQDVFIETYNLVCNLLFLVFLFICDCTMLLVEVPL